MTKINLTHRLALPGVLVLVTVYLAVTNYPGLPELIPTHFGPNGTPDSWGKKSFFNIFSLPILQFSLYALLAALTVIFSKRQNIRDMINLPGRDKLTAEQLEQIRTIIVDGISLLNLFTTTMLFYIQFGMFKIAYHRWSDLGPTVWVFTILIVMSAGWMLYRIFQVRK